MVTEFASLNGVVQAVKYLTLSSDILGAPPVMALWTQTASHALRIATSTNFYNAFDRLIFKDQTVPSSMDPVRIDDRFATYPMYELCATVMLNWMT